MATTQHSGPLIHLPLQGAAPYRPSWCCLLHVACLRPNDRWHKLDVSPAFAGCSGRYRRLPPAVGALATLKWTPGTGLRSSARRSERLIPDVKGLLELMGPGKLPSPCAPPPQLREESSGCVSGCRVDKTGRSPNGTATMPGLTNSSVNCRGVRCNSPSDTTAIPFTRGCFSPGRPPRRRQAARHPAAG